MIIPHGVVRGYDTAVSQLSVAAIGELSALMQATAEMSPEMQRAVLFEAFPDVFNPYAAASSAVSASFYEEMRALQGVTGQFAAQTLDAVEAPRWNALVGWGTRGSVLEQGGTALMFSLLSGGLTRALAEIAADTIIGNAENEPTVTMGYQRVPSPGCCAWCGMLASRHAGYTSEDAALTVVGRGTPVEKNYTRAGRRKRGGQAKGIHPRGSRRVGESFHDHCRCKAVPVTNANAVQMQEDADKYYDAYLEAREKATGKLERNVTTSMSPDGSRHNEYEWVDDAGDSFKSDNALTKRIVAEMRESLSVK